MDSEEVRRRVRQILKEEPKARENDRWLYAIYLLRYHNLKFSEEQLAKFIGFEEIESVKRRRQELHEAGEFLPDNKWIRQKRDRFGHSDHDAKFHERYGSLFEEKIEQ